MELKLEKILDKTCIDLVYWQAGTPSQYFSLFGILMELYEPSSLPTVCGDQFHPGSRDRNTDFVICNDPATSD